MTRTFRSIVILAGLAVVLLPAAAARAQSSAANDEPPALFSVDQELVDAGYFDRAPTLAAACCIPDGSVDDTLSMWSCCSGYAVSGSTVCTIPSDYGTTWKSCRHVCGTRPVNGCIPSGGIDDTLSNTHCCSGQAVSGSTWCLDPADYGTDWKSCVQTCQ
jgi:hypothetical protein